MSGSLDQKAPDWIKRAMALMLALVASATLYLGVEVPHASAQIQTDFCVNVWLQPNGEKCWGHLNYLAEAFVVTQEHAGCVDVADGSNNLLQSWKCVGDHSWTEIILGNDGTLRKAVIRNNSGAAAHFTGHVVCYVEECFA
jgi:hypothetical protein